MKEYVAMSQHICVSPMLQHSISYNMKKNPKKTLNLLTGSLTSKVETMPKNDRILFILLTL